MRARARIFALLTKTVTDRETNCQRNLSQCICRDDERPSRICPCVCEFQLSVGLCVYHHRTRIWLIIRISHRKHIRFVRALRTYVDIFACVIVLCVCVCAYAQTLYSHRIVPSRMYCTLAPHDVGVHAFSF